MAAEPQLTPACELAFAVARDGVDASPAFEPPVAMRSFLHVPQLPRRALTVAQRVLDEDPQFRARVAERASEEAVGRAGWLWLSRPEGWETEVSALTGRVPSGLVAARALPPAEEEAHVATVGATEGAALGGDRLLLTDLERELDALRSLVTRVATEQQTAPAVVQQLEAEVEQRDVELAGAREERDALAAALEAALDERDDARARIAETGEQLERVRRELEDMAAQRVASQDEVQRLTDAHHQAASAHQQRVDELTEGLRQVEHQRDELALALERAIAERTEAGSDRVGPVAADACDQIGSAVLPSLSSAGEAARLLGSAIDEAVHRLELLQGTLGSLTDVVEASAESPVTEPVPGSEVDVPLLQADEPLPVEPIAADTGDTATTEHDHGDQQGGDDEGAATIDDEAGWQLTDLLAMYSTGDRSAEGSVEAFPGGDTCPDPWGAPERPAEDLPTAVDGGAGTEWARLLDEAADGPSADRDRTGVDEPDWGSLLEPAREAWTNPGERATRRRCPDVPEELRPDPVAVAGFLVAVPDVIVIIDGDAVASLGWPSLPVAEQRDALVSYLTDLAATTGAAPDVVFDGRMDDGQALPMSDTVRVRLTAPGVTAARAVAELIDTYPVDWPVVVVADDAQLVDDAAQRGATTLSNVQLLDLFIAQ